MHEALPAMKYFTDARICALGADATPSTHIEGSVAVLAERGSARCISAGLGHCSRRSTQVGMFIPQDIFIAASRPSLALQAPRICQSV